MQIVFLFLGGFFLGGVAVLWTLFRAERRSHGDISYELIKRSVLMHLRTHGTINRPQLEHLISVDRMTATQCLYRIERDGLIKHQGHDPVSGFYTLS